MWREGRYCTENQRADNNTHNNKNGYNNAAHLRTRRIQIPCRLTQLTNTLAHVPVCAGDICLDVI